MHELTVGPRVEPTVATKPIAFPGRWLGGGVGVIATLLVAGVLALIQHVLGDPQLPADSSPFTAGAAVALLGVPIAFALGRHYAPVARDGGWGTAAFTVLCFALLAPPLGDLEIIVGAALAPWTFGSLEPASVLASGVLIGVIGLFVSFVALPVTAAVAIAWIVLMRLLPRDWAARVAMPASVARFGVRHAVYVLLASLLIVWTVWSIARPPVVEPGFSLATNLR